jgi:hypothetical protein
MNIRALRQHDDTPRGDDIVVLHDISWEDYERLLVMRGDHIFGTGRRNRPQLAIEVSWRSTGSSAWMRSGTGARV